MRRSQMRAVALYLALVLVPAWGCGEGPPPTSSSLTEANVTGTVKLRGKLVTKGEVSFNPSNIRRPDEKARLAPISSDGTYTIKTLIGQNSVEVIAPAVAQDFAVGASPLSFDVVPGENTFNIELPPPD